MPIPPSFAGDSRLVPLQVADQRAAQVFGAPATIVLVPERAKRADRPDGTAGERAAFRRSPAERIVADEVLWSGQGVVLTPNRYPFLAEQLLLWPQTARRWPDLAMWQTAHDWVAAHDGSGLHNVIGAAASIARAHVHLTRERSQFLATLPVRTPALQLIAGAQHQLEVQAVDVPFCLLRLRGPAAARAQGLVDLAEALLCPSWNVVIEPDATFVYARSIETPAPHFDYALGAAELWGRWCHSDAATFARATSMAMASALVTAGKPPL